MTKEEFDKKIKELVKKSNFNRKPYRFVNENMLNNAYIMITQGYRFKDLKQQYNNFTIRIYYALFNLMIEWQHEQPKVHIQYVKQPYWQTEDEMIIPNYTFEGLSIVEQEIYKGL
jgi:hypothetical protein